MRTMFQVFNFLYNISPEVDLIGTILQVMKWRPGKFK